MPVLERTGRAGESGRKSLPFFPADLRTDPTMKVNGAVVREYVGGGRVGELAARRARHDSEVAPLDEMRSVARPSRTLTRRRQSLQPAPLLPVITVAGGGGWLTCARRDG